MKRFIAVLVCVFMLTSMIPAVAFADDGADPAQNPQQEQQLDQQDPEQKEPDQQDPEQQDPEQKDPEQKEPEQQEQHKKTGASIQSTTPQEDPSPVDEGGEQTIKYIITTAVMPSAGGSVTGAGEYGADETVVLSAIANTGYKFAGWREGDKFIEGETEATYSFTATKNRNVIAYFVEDDVPDDSHKITAVAMPAEGGTVGGAGNFVTNATATLTATANTGYRFAGWREGGVDLGETDVTYAFTVTKGRNLVAYFVEEEVPVGSHRITAVAMPAEGGTVNGAGDYETGTEATLTATPNEGYKFVGWREGDVDLGATDVTYKFTVTKGHNITAAFEKIEDNTTPPAVTDVKTTTNLKASCKTVVKGACISFIVTVKDADKKAVETGTVKLFVNGKEISSASAGAHLTWTMPASFKNNFELGKNTIKVEYSGAEGYEASSDTVEVKVVKAACKPVNPCKPCNVCNTCTNNGKCATVRAGEDVILKVSLSCGETCQWYVDKGDGCGFVKIKGADEATYTVKDATSKMDGYKYRCVITKACKVVAKPTFTLNVVSGGCLTVPKTGDVSVVFPVLAMGAAAAALLRRKDEE